MSRLLVLILPCPADRPDPVLLRELFDLTQGESRVAALVGAGKSPQETAVALGITEQSARTVLKRVFAKTNTSRQAELAAVMSRMLLNPEP